MPAPPTPRLIFLVTEDWYFWSHRLPTARAAAAAGFEVAVATRVAAHGERIRAEGFRLHPLPWRRGSLDPLAALRDVLAIARLYRRERPAIVHHVAVKPAVLGALAAVLAGVPAVVTTLAGLGLSMSGRGLRAAAARLVLKGALALAGLGRRSVLVVQNRDDLERLSRGPLPPRRTQLVRGSGVDLGRFRPLPEPDGPVTCLQVSRMLTLKGVEELVEAVRRVRARGTDLHLLLAGDPDPESAAAIPEESLRRWSAEPGIEWLGRVEDVAGLWARAHVAVLASRGGEGVPKTLLEAAACGRPIVATDVPGTREVALPGRNALLVPPGDAGALAAALERIAADPALRRTLAAASRAVVEPEFGDAEVGRRMAALYRSLAGRGDPPVTV